MRHGSITKLLVKASADGNSSAVEDLIKENKDRGFPIDPKAGVAVLESSPGPDLVRALMEVYQCVMRPLERSMQMPFVQWLQRCVCVCVCAQSYLTLCL